MEEYSGFITGIRTCNENTYNLIGGGCHANTARKHDGRCNDRETNYHHFRSADIHFHSQVSSYYNNLGMWDTTTTTIQPPVVSLIDVMYLHKDENKNDIQMKQKSPTCSTNYKCHQTFASQKFTLYWYPKFCAASSTLTQDIHSSFVASWCTSFVPWRRYSFKYPAANSATFSNVPIHFAKSTDQQKRMKKKKICQNKTHQTLQTNA